MSRAVLEDLGRQLRLARRSAGLSQTEVSKRTSRHANRLIQLEHSLLTGRLGLDRLSLVAELCETLGLSLVLVNRYDGLPVDHQPTGAEKCRNADTGLTLLLDEILEKN